MRRIEVKTLKKTRGFEAEEEKKKEEEEREE